MAPTQDDDSALKVARSLHAREKTSRAFDIKLVDAKEGRARASMIVRDDMLNGHAIAHGGMIFTLADTAFAWACNSRNEKTVAQHASITFLRAVQSGETLVADARETSTRGRSGVYDVTVTNGDREMVAVFQGLSRTIGGAVIGNG